MAAGTHETGVEIILVGVMMYLLVLDEGSRTTRLDDEPCLEI